ncbi:MAG: hypothetical protein HKP03_05010 [Xanthomonadales bacterium]|nr:hypothetical protein [Xanthomonadales bacterium]
MLKSRALILVLCCLLAACQPQPAPDASPAPPAGPEWPVFDYEGAVAGGTPVFRLDSSSRIDIVVRRDGPLARFGHDHVISATEPEGFLLLDDRMSGTRAELRFRTDRLEVDAAADRVRYRLDTEPDEDAVRGTRENLETRVLEVERWPFAHVELKGFNTEGDRTSANVEVTLQGHTHRSRESFRLSRRGGEVAVEGSFTLSQAALGLEPFSVLGGGLRVADLLEIHVRLLGLPLNPD